MHAVRRPRGRDGRALERPSREVDGHARASSLTVVGDAGVGKSRLDPRVRGPAAGRARPGRSAAAACRTATASPSGRSRRSSASAARISDEDRARSRSQDRPAARARLAARTSARRSSTGWPPRSACRRAVPGPELFWGTRRLLEAIASRAAAGRASSTTSTGRRRRSSSSSTTCSSRPRRRRSCCSARRATSSLERARRVGRGPRGDADPARAAVGDADADAIVEQLLGGARRERPRADRRGGRGQSAVRRADHLDARRDRGAPSGRRALGRQRRRRTSSQIPPTVQALRRRPPRRARPRGARRHRPGLGDRPGFAVDAVVELVAGRGRRPRSRQRLDVADRASSSCGRRVGRGGRSTASATRSSRTPPTAACSSAIAPTLHERFVDWAERVNRERGRELEFEEILGYHLEQAYRYRTELGPLDDDGRRGRPRAADKLGSAGRRAFGRGDTPAAANLLATRARRPSPSDDPWRTELLPDLAEALTEQGDFAGARAGAR